jgi:hypothetical protein
MVEGEEKETSLYLDAVWVLWAVWSKVAVARLGQKAIQTTQTAE